jgi:hypothetical protein
VVRVSCGSVQSAPQEEELNRLVLDHGPSWRVVRTSGAVWVGVLCVTAEKGSCAGSYTVVEKQLSQGPGEGLLRARL